MSGVEEKPIFVQGSLGYQNVLSLGSKYIASKVTQALQASASLSIHSGQDELRDLTVEQVLLLCLLHSLMIKDVAACYIFTEIASKIESLKSPHFKAWLQEEFFFSYEDVRKALSLAAELTSAGLQFPEVVLVILENLYYIYCAPTKRRSLVEANKEEQISTPIPLNGKNDEDKTSAAPQVEDKALKNQYSPKPRKIDDHSHLKHTPVLLPTRVLGEYSQCEQFALHRENLASPKKKDSPFEPFMKEISTPPPYQILRQLSGEFISKEITTCSSTTPIMESSRNSGSFKEFATEADALNEKTGDTALHLAVLRNNLEAVQTLIRRGARIDVSNKADVTPMQIAVEREHLDIIRALHAAGADVNRRNTKGESLLHIAAASAGVETIDLLIELKADLDCLDSRKQTPLFRAAKKGYIVVMEALDESGADIHIVDTYERSLLHYAAWHGQVEAVNWLLKNGLKINALTKHKMTPLHWAVANGQLKVAQVLLRSGADVNAKDSAQRTPLVWAAEVGNVALVDLLKSYNGTL